MNDFDTDLLSKDTDNRGGVILANLSKIVAVIAALGATMVTFTDITFGSLVTEEITTVLVLLLLAAYVIYFSLEDAGERRGEESEEFIAAYTRHSALRERVLPEMIPELRQFAADYSMAEAKHRRDNELMRLGYTEDELTAYTRGEITDRRAKRALRRVMAIRPVCLTAASLLSRERWRARSELYNPERGKHLKMSLKLLPTALCMVVTVSVVFSTKDNLGAKEICEGIMKLSTLPVVGIRGYLSGVAYARETRAGWLETKSRLLECFLGNRKA